MPNPSRRLGCRKSDSRCRRRRRSLLDSVTRRTPRRPAASISGRRVPKTVAIRPDRSRASSIASRPAGPFLTGCGSKFMAARGFRTAIGRFTRNAPASTPFGMCTTSDRADAAAHQDVHHPASDAHLCAGQSESASSSTSVGKTLSPCKKRIDGRSSTVASRSRAISCARRSTRRCVRRGSQELHGVDHQIALQHLIRVQVGEAVLDGAVEVEPRQIIETPHP